MSTAQKVLLLKLTIHLCALGLLVEQYALAINDQLGGDPVKAIIHFTGIGAFNLLLLTLLVSPLAQRFKLGFLMQTRRLLGLYAFTYASCHVVNFLAFDLQFEWRFFLEEVFKRPYITLGMLAFIWLIPMAITSITWFKRKMKGNWQRLHNGNYLIVILVAIHFYWSVKSELIEPSIYLLATLFLLALRKDKLKRLFQSLVKYRKNTSTCR
ncbi:protein-methionine-sulfoxide reductase heme-binding subunit MsrQ [Thalassotalea sp. LPB0316]|uniref:protein-methionine-sulfoxide reductase heme-binding subunit MsrQ n=1 Tax=Thalassotalea sp. LPB0316 TaxID=2769490 RepID=UPI001867B71F|nr:protein-methionine-sulfoxide reductase heme-binding subunit MsrQ [Thalassotalea sp. LPB0316]QOL25562.1 protein-methionine-sulfoxide reductase heme-binding subunit MsrQ [Thalassotalea sp. LPB0316]